MPELWGRKQLIVRNEYESTGDPNFDRRLKEHSDEIRKQFRQDIQRKIHDGRNFVFLGLGQHPPAKEELEVGPCVFRNAPNCVYSQYTNHLYFFGRSHTLYLYVEWK